ncbi:plasmid mobilization relaxosome protein MobC [Chitinophaga lutea]|uniref:Plasmid mobilization relaxosome protein MobC n=1 Tax=Chitinophaga lutea TaxID=2488634 RepID=A0A3N4QAZ4_9BACT|nr:plasmid mobilization relaxosome protein MobC [Chitinophaga lutea]RPE13157.1 plasmid mobilization relaxosome protein MobC [Chitinophaga lutea]
MRKGQTKGEAGLTKLVWTRLTEKQYTRLQRVLDGTKGETLSSLIRKILQRQQIRIYVEEESMHATMEELAAIRAEIKAIGHNINQITRHFNGHPELHERVWSAKEALSSYTNMEAKTDQLLAIISKLAKKWLQNSN